MLLLPLQQEWRETSRAAAKPARPQRASELQAALPGLSLLLLLVAVWVVIPWSKQSRAMLLEVLGSFRELLLLLALLAAYFPLDLGRLLLVQQVSKEP
jgi:hypothetical protein